MQVVQVVQLCDLSKGCHELATSGSPVNCGSFLASSLSMYLGSSTSTTERSRFLTIMIMMMMRMMMKSCLGTSMLVSFQLFISG